MSEEEVLLLPQIPVEKIPSYTQIVQVNLYHFYILGAINEVDKYLDMIHTLKTSDENDTILIYINSFGGNLFTAIQIINAIQNSRATVITCLEGEAYSAATIIFLAGHKHIINKFGAFMVHKYSHGVEGKGSDVAAQVKFTEKYFHEMAYSVYEDLMSKEEISLMLDGRDFWFSSNEVAARLKSSGREILESENNAIHEEIVEVTENKEPTKRGRKKK